MIYITGDTHSIFSRFEIERFPIQEQMTKNDYVIICGDFGGGTYKKDFLTDYLQEISEKLEFKSMF